MNLQNYFLIAIPSLPDYQFQQSVVYICDHSPRGAMGLIVNKPISNSSTQRLLSDLRITQQQTHLADNSTITDAPMFYGGPLAEDNIFVLHTPRYGFSSTISISSGVMITTSEDILSTLNTAQKPEHSLILLGYSAWSEGQLEQEIINNSWLVVEADPKIIFDTPIEQKWQTAAGKLGIDITTISNNVGHA